VSLSAAGPLGLGFLGARLFRFENPDLGGCFSLDFLGFSRSNRELSMGYTGKTAEEFFVVFLPLGHSQRR
jgi:hypothetical protein